MTTMTSSTEGLALVGTNYVDLNEATVKAALEFYFAAVFKNPPIVKSINANPPNTGPLLRITVSAPEHKEILP